MIRDVLLVEGINLDLNVANKEECEYPSDNP